VRGAALCLRYGYAQQYSLASVLVALKLAKIGVMLGWTQNTLDFLRKAQM